MVYPQYVDHTVYKDTKRYVVELSGLSSVRSHVIGRIAAPYGKKLASSQLVASIIGVSSIMLTVSPIEYPVSWVEYLASNPISLPSSEILLDTVASYGTSFPIRYPETPLVAS